MMERRTFIGATAAALIVVSLDVWAQQSNQARRIGWLWLEPPQTAEEIHEKGAHLRALGWVEGQNLIVERRYSDPGNAHQLKANAEELVRLKVELIVAEGTVATLAAKKATSSVPIVVSRSGDPVGTGLVASLARPGANVTGTSTIVPDLIQKQVQLLHELLPAARKVGELILPANPLYRAMRNEYEQAYRALGMQPIFVGVGKATELEDSIEEAQRQGAQVLHVVPEPLFYANFPLIVSAAQKRSLPILVQNEGMLEEGGLLSYAPDEMDLDRKLASFVDKILRGAKPADLPVQQPTKFKLLINLKTAKAIGITVPQSLLLRADEVI